MALDAGAVFGRVVPFGYQPSAVAGLLAFRLFEHHTSAVAAVAGTAGGLEPLREVLAYGVPFVAVEAQGFPPVGRGVVGAVFAAPFD